MGMRKSDWEIVFKEDFYKECGSPMLPIPVSMEDMLEVTQVNYLARDVIADNLLQMVKDFPERINTYHRLLVHCCLVAGGEAAHKGDHHRSNYYFLKAVDFAPGNFEVHKNLARSYQHLGLFYEAICHYQFVIDNQKNFHPSLWVYLLECMHAKGEVEEAKKLFDMLFEVMSDPKVNQKLVFGVLGVSILTQDNAPEELKNMFDRLFYDTM
ncbi:MAG: tetratricopeptide repeat protein [Anaerolineaceae bacterium]|nr:tetratricopeptide repeat protein [Anaerolineaceae bacterium]